MKISKQARREAKDLFRSVQAVGGLDEKRALQIVDQILSIKPRGYAAILSHFQRLLKLDMDRRSARIESVIPLDSAQEDSVKSTLTKRYGSGLNFAFQQNPALIGGMRIQVGSDVYDGSIQSRLAQLKEV
jgi:F-type H+-transporting ATPase subunit delta